MDEHRLRVFETRARWIFKSKKEAMSMRREAGTNYPCPIVWK
jgi:hypothetical protein